MMFDPERYRRDVLDPARKSNAPPADLFTRYALTPAVMSDDRAFAAHLMEVENYWRTLKQDVVYRKLADSLLGAHEKLQRTGCLGRDKLRQERAEALDRAQERLQKLVADLAKASSCITLDTRDQLAEALEGMIDKGTMNKALRQAGVRIVEPCELPSAPPIQPVKYRELREHLNVLGLRFSAELVLGDAIRKGFRVLNGFRLSSGAPLALDAERIRQVRQEREKEAQDELKTATSNALAILLVAESAATGTLQQLLLWEVIDALRPFVEISRSQRGVAREAAALGLDPGEAEVLALSLIGARTGGGVNTALLAVENALTAGELRTAQQLARSLRPTDDDARDLLERLEAADREVAELSAKAEQACAARSTEDAAELLVQALRVAGDDADLRQRLDALPPPPPTDVRAGLEGSGVAITWLPSASRTGAVRYRVTRGNGRPVLTARHSAPLGEPDTTELVDPSPPVGKPLYYSVFAARGQAWSEATSVGPVVVTPEVADLRLDADVRSVTGSWRVDPRAAEILVVRTEGRPPRTSTDGQRVRLGTISAFTDTGVRTGVAYYYRVSVVYLTSDGRRHVSPGLVASATPEPAPAAVTDLRVEMLPDPGASCIQLIWTIPDSGAVSVHLSEAPLPWPAGATASPAELSAFGQPLQGTPERLPNGQARLTVPTVQGRRFLTATTSNSCQAVIGNTVELTVGEPVRRLVAERLAGVIRLSWVWPDESTSARIRWWPTGAEAEFRGEVECLRRGYLDGGGFDVDVGPEAVTVAVQALISQVGGEVASTPATIDVPGLGIQVRYSIRWFGWPRPKRAMLGLSADSPCALPPILVVRRAGSVMPLGPHQGEVIRRIPAQPLDPQTPCAIEFDVPVVRGPSWLMCFLESGAQSGITLIHPPVSELKGG